MLGFGKKRYAQYELELGEASKALAAADARIAQLEEEQVEDRYIIGQLRLRLVECEERCADAALPADGEPNFQAIKQHHNTVSRGQFA